MSSTNNSATDLASLTGTWVLDPSRTTIEFRTKAMWVMNVKGTAKALAGSGVVGDGEAVSGRFEVDMSSVSTGNKKRDDHLQSADFFDTTKFPTMTFEFTSSHLSGPGRATLTGTLNVHGQTRPLTVPAEFRASTDTVDVTAEFPIDRSQWGMTWAKMGAGIHNQVSVKARFNKG